MYYFLDWIKAKDEEGYEPSIPNGVDFALIADNRNIEDRWGLFECHPEEFELLKDNEVSEHLTTLLNSAVKFPPVMAYSKYEIERKSKTSVYSKNTFESDLCQIIEENIKKAKVANFIFAQARTDEVGYLAKGEFVWIVGAKRNKLGDISVTWVSDDYFLYENSSKDFHLANSEIEELINA